MIYLTIIIYLVCQDSPCLNSGTCRVDTAEPWKIICNCKPGFKGKYCEFSDVVTSSHLRATGTGSFLLIKPFSKLSKAQSFMIENASFCDF